MQIHLLAEAGRSLEFGSELTPIDQHFASNDAHPLSLCQSIEQCRLASARRTHECNHDTWLDVAVDLVQKLPLTAEIRNSVLDILPGKDALAFGEVLDSVFFLGYYVVRGRA